MPTVDVVSYFAFCFNVIKSSYQPNLCLFVYIKRIENLK